MSQPFLAFRVVSKRFMSAVANADGIRCDHQFRVKKVIRSGLLGNPAA